MSTVVSTEHELLTPIKIHDTPWTPSAAQGTPKVMLNIALDGCIVPSDTGGARVDYSHLVVLDNFIDESIRQQLIDYLTEPGWTAEYSNRRPPQSKWEQATCDSADVASKPSARTWGLSPSVLQQFAANNIPAKLEVQSRLSKLYPDLLISHMPSEHIQVGLDYQQDVTEGRHQQQQHFHAVLQEKSATARDDCRAQQQEQQAEQQLHTTPAARQDSPAHHQQQHNGLHCTPAEQSNEPSAVQADCSCFLANAAVHGDNFSWHVDADPSTFPAPSPWTQTYGQYCNREPGKPLLFSLLLYLDKEWPLGYDAETLFLDSITDTGIFVRPKAYRAVLMDQDVAHRLSAPSSAARRPRYSLVWKLAMLPKLPGGECSLARPEWGAPTYFGSAAHVRQAALAAAAGGAAGKAASRKRAAEQLIQQP